MVLIIASLFVPVHAQSSLETTDGSPDQHLGTWGDLATPGAAKSTYENSAYGFQISYPQDWQADEPDANDLGLVYGMLPPDEDIEDPQDYVALQVEMLPEGATLEQYARGLVQTMKQSNSNLQILGIRNAILGDSAAGAMEVSFQEANYRFKALKTFTIKDCKAYIITYNALEEDYDGYLETVREIIDSFEFEKSVSPEPAIGSLLSGSRSEERKEQSEEPAVVNDSITVYDTAREWNHTQATETGASSDVEAEIISLDDPDAGTRAKSAAALGKMNDTRAIEPLIQALRDEDGDVQLEAEQALGEIGEAAIEPLIQALRDDSQDFRFEVGYALRYIGNPAVAPLIRVLEDADWRVRSGAADALGEIQDPAAVELLIRALHDQNSSVSFSAAYALGNIGSTAVQPLIEALNDTDGMVRSRAAYALGKTEDSRAVEPLIQALNDKDSVVRGDAADALGEIRDPSAVEPLIEALKDEDWLVRYEAAASLGRIKDPRAVEPLIQALGDEDLLVRKYAAHALGELNDSRAIDPLETALDDEDDDVRSAAQEALDMIETES